MGLEGTFNVDYVMDKTECYITLIKLDYWIVNSFGWNFFFPDNDCNTPHTL